MCENHSTIWPILKYFSTDKYINLKFLKFLKSCQYTTKIYLYMHLAGVYLAGVHLGVVYLASVHLAGAHLPGTWASCTWPACI
jgi:hypothetical protein